MVTINELTKADVRKMSNAELDAGLELNLKAHTLSLRNVALIYMEKKERGQPLPSSCGQLVEFFPAIADGKLLPELALKLGDSDIVLASITTLVPEEQQKILANNAKIDLLVPNAQQTSYEVVEKHLEDLKPHEVRQVIVDGRLLTPAQQQRYARPLQPKPSPMPSKPKHDEWLDHTLREILSPEQVIALERVAERQKPPISPINVIVRALVQYWKIPATKLGSIAAKTISAIEKLYGAQL